MPIMRILITNDDGYRAEGLLALHEALRDLVECVVVAPHSDRSASSHALTVRQALAVHRHSDECISVEGTPVDCVHLACGGLLEHPPDMVVSGINSGMNMGDDVLYSGTVAAACEGRFQSLPAIAFSLARFNPAQYATAASVARRMIEQVIDGRFSGATFLNVNIPDVPAHELKGIQSTRLGRRHRSGDAAPDRDKGNAFYWLGPPGRIADDSPGTDFHAVANGYVSVTPLQSDMTNHSAVASVANWVDGIA
ncbi:MAG: 5'/3'-nucleotidase SurE [Pseudomonadota bacterium]